MTTHADTEIEVVVWTPSQPSWNGQILSRGEARRLIDHTRFFWIDAKDWLVWIGPASELTGDQVARGKPLR